MKFHYTDDKLPEPYVDVLCFYGVGRNEFQVLYISNDGNWNSRLNIMRLSKPDYWAKLPNVEEVE